MLEFEGRLKPNPWGGSLGINKALVDHGIGRQAYRATDMQSRREFVVKPRLNVAPLAKPVGSLLHANFKTPATLAGIPLQRSSRGDWTWRVVWRRKIVRGQNDTTRFRLGAHLAGGRRKDER